LQPEGGVLLFRRERLGVRIAANQAPRAQAEKQRSQHAEQHTARAAAPRRGAPEVFRRPLLLPHDFSEELGDEVRP
jgi:hypothetical protein